MKIVYLINSATYGGAERHLLDLASGMVEKGHEVWIFSPLGPIVSMYQQKGIHYKELYPKIDIDLKYIFTVRRFLLEQSIDVVHTHLLKSTANGLLAGYLAKTQMKVAHIHGSLISWEVPWYKRYSNVFMNSLIQNFFADKVVALTQAVKKELVEKERILAHKIVVIPNGIDVNKYERKGRKHYFHQKYDLKKEITIIGTIGRLTIERGQTYLIQAAKDVIKEFPSTRFVIIGEGSLHVTYKKLIDELGLKEYVFLEGFMEEDTKADILQSLDMYVSPATREGFGIALVEAMASKLPIVATELAVTKEICPHEQCGFLVPSEDSNGLRDGILQLLHNKEKQVILAENAYNRAIEKYSLSVFVNNYLRLYTEFLNNDYHE